MIHGVSVGGKGSVRGGRLKKFPTQFGLCRRSVTSDIGPCAGDTCEMSLDNRPVAEAVSPSWDF